MSSMTVLFFLILIVLLAILGDHYARLQKMGWAPEVEDYKAGRSLLDPAGSLFGELGRADMPYRIAASVFDLIGKFSEFVWAPIGTVFGLIGTFSEMAYKPIGFALGAVTGFGLKN
jgi:hypothetical protein